MYIYKIYTSIERERERKEEFSCIIYILFFFLYVASFIAFYDRSPLKNLQPDYVEYRHVYLTQDLVRAL